MRGTAASQRTGTRDERIIVVDDDPLYSTCLARMLAPYGAIQFANAVDDALAVIRDPRPVRAGIFDLWLCDRITGLDLIQELRRVHQATPALLITGNIDMHPANAAYIADVDFLEKPFTRAHIDHFMTSHLPLNERLGLVAKKWERRYNLTCAHIDILLRSARGESRDAIAIAREASPLTIKRQVADLLPRTMDANLAAAVNRMIKEAVDMCAHVNRGAIQD